MAAIGAVRAQALLDAAHKAGMTDGQISDFVRRLGRSVEYMENLSTKDERSFEDHIARVAAVTNRRAGNATPRQVDEIMRLLRDHPGGGMTIGFPTDRAGVANLSFDDASL